MTLAFQSVAQLFKWYQTYHVLPDGDFNIWECKMQIQHPHVLFSVLPSSEDGKNDYEKHQVRCSREEVSNFTTLTFSGHMVWLVLFHQPARPNATNKSSFPVMHNIASLKPKYTF